MKTKDSDIRSVLSQKLRETHQDDDSSIIVNEMALCQGESRIDIAVINGVIHGYEIKSEADTLTRLPGQINTYERVFDYLTIVTGPNHVAHIESSVPEWCGITVARINDESIVELSPLREPTQNKDTDPLSVAQLLWKSEALNVLTRFGLEKGYISKPKRVIWGKLVASFSPDDLAFYVREQIKARNDWQVVI